MTCICGQTYDLNAGSGPGPVLCGRCGRVLALGRFNPAEAAAPPPPPRTATPAGAAWIDHNAPRWGALAGAGRIARPLLAGVAILGLAVLLIRSRTAVHEEAFSRFETASLGAARKDLGGLGRLKVINATGLDISAWLIDESPGHAVRRQVTVKKYRDASLPAIQPGLYKLRYCAGIGWNEAMNRFNLTSYCEEYTEPFVFTESQEGPRTIYNVQVLTVHGRRPTGSTHPVAGP